MLRRSCLGLLSAALLGVLPFAAAAQTPPATPAPAAAPAPTPSGPIYAVTYFEVAPASSRKAIGLLRQFSDASRKEDGNVEFIALREITRPGRFAIFEAWRDKAALDAHAKTMAAFGAKWTDAILAPFDARQFWAMAVAPSARPEPVGFSGAVYVLTHVDVFPAGKDQVAALLKQLADDSRKDSGSLRFDAVIQDARPNHFHLIEAWAGRPARDAHALAPHTREFRAKLVPFEGALYDERLYEAVR